MPRLARPSPVPGLGGNCSGCCPHTLHLLRSEPSAVTDQPVGYLKPEHISTVGGFDGGFERSAIVQFVVAPCIGAPAGPLLMRRLVGVNEAACSDRPADLWRKRSGTVGGVGLILVVREQCDVTRV